MSNKTILVTGASGFIGRALVKILCQQNYRVRATVRSQESLQLLLAYQQQYNLENLTIYNVGELTGNTNWNTSLQDVDTVIHCAARAHILKEIAANPLEEFRKINCEGTIHLAKKAREFGARRFIFLSSIGVLGNYSDLLPFSEHSMPNPQSPYAQAKWEAELALLQLPPPMDKVIVRPPLVYGPGVKGNFEKLINLVNKKIPLPFGRVQNKRQFIGIDNLVDFIITCIEPQLAANEIFVAADKESISTTQLIRHLSLAMGHSAILLPAPEPLLRLTLKGLGKSKLVEQLLNNLEVNANKAKEILNWEAPYSMAQQIELTAEYYRR